MSPTIFLPCGWLAVSMGTAALLPVSVSWLEGGSPAIATSTVVAAAVALLVCGVTALAVGSGRKGRSELPTGVRVALIANVLGLSFLSLELSDRLVR